MIESKAKNVIDLVGKLLVVQNCCKVFAFQKSGKCLPQQSACNVSTGIASSVLKQNSEIYSATLHALLHKLTSEMF